VTAPINGTGTKCSGESEGKERRRDGHGGPGCDGCRSSQYETRGVRETRGDAEVAPVRGSAAAGVALGKCVRLGKG